jgi:hypothetical protein
MINSYLRILVSTILSLALLSCSGDKSDFEGWEPPISAISVSPNLSLDKKGSPILSWMRVDGETVYLEYARLESKQWSPPITVSSGGNWLVNRADFPSVVQLTDSLWAAHWLVFTDPSTFAYDVFISLSRDGGKTWEEGFSPHTDGTISEHGFVSFFADESDVGVVWLDGRNMLGGHANEAAQHVHSEGIDGMALRSTKFTSMGLISDDQEIDDLVCDCCQTDISATPDGPILVFRNRTENEHRDIYFSRMINGQWSKSKPVAVDNWLIGGCPVNGPSVAANQNRTAVAWYTQAKGFGEVKVALSDNGSDNFNSPINIDTGEDVLGQVGLAPLDEGGFVISWMTHKEGTSGELRVQYIDDLGVTSQSIVKENISNTRIAGLPQMVLHDENIVLAWTGGSNFQKSVEVKKTRLNALK